MTDPTMPSLDIFKAQSAINVRSVLDSVEESKEQERIQNFIQKRKAETNVVKQETEEFVQNNKISHFQEPVNAKDYPQDRKTEQRYEDEKKRKF